ncbi:hypothetical protein AB6D11_01065 [Vibrio splendidus]
MSTVTPLMGQYMAMMTEQGMTKRAALEHLCEVANIKYNKSYHQRWFSLRGSPPCKVVLAAQRLTLAHQLNAQGIKVTPKQLACLSAGLCQL